jgi:hypothetical protein
LVSGLLSGSFLRMAAYVNRRPSRTLDRFRGALPIAYAECDPLVVAEVELAQIPLQMLPADAMIDAVNAALEDRK